MSKNQRRVFGFTLCINNKTHKVSISKRKFDVEISDQEDGSTRILLASPDGRARLRVSNVDPDEHNIPSKRADTVGLELEISISDWESLKRGEILSWPGKKNQSKYISLNLDKLLELPGVVMDEKLIDFLYGYISAR